MLPPKKSTSPPSGRLTALAVIMSLGILMLSAAAAATEATEAYEDVYDTLPVLVLDSESDLDNLSDQEISSQHLDAQSIRPVESITVVGSRIPKAITDIAESISILDTVALESAQASNMAEALGNLPGVAVEGGPRANGSFINVRGLSGPRVLVVVDGARQNFLGGHRSSLLMDPELFKQVELLRGPASALWGSDALGGVVYMTTKDAGDFLQPNQTFGIRTRLAFEENGNEFLRSGILASRIGGLDVVASLSKRASDDYVRGDGESEPHSDQDQAANLVKMSWLPDSGTHQFSLTRQRFQQANLSPSNPSIAVNDTNPLLDRLNDATYSLGKYEFSGNRWLEAGQLNIYRSDLLIHEDRVGEPRQDVTRFVTDGANSHLAIPQPWLGNGDGLLIVGADAFLDHSEATRNGESRPQFPDADRKQVGMFAQLEMSFGDLTFVPGLRLDRYRAKSNQEDVPDVDETASSPKLGLIWAFNDALTFRGSINHAFRAPGLVELYASGQHFLGNNFVPNAALRPEKSRNIEVGFNLSLPGWASEHRATVDFSAYRNQIDDYIELFVDVVTETGALQCLPPFPAVGCINRDENGLPNANPPIFIGGVTGSRNLPSATITGGEIQARYDFGLFEISLDASHIRGSDDKTGMPLLSIAPDRLQSAVTWKPFRSLRTSLSVVHDTAQDRVPTILDEEGETQDVIPKTRASTIWNANLVWEPEHAFLTGLQSPRLVIGVDNITDQDYRRHLNTLKSPGRNIRASLSAAF